MFLRYDEPSAVIDRGFNPNYALCAALIRKSVPSPLVRQIILIEDGLGGTHRFACTAVDALVGVDVQRAGTLVNAVDGALVHASLVLDIHARLSDYIWHGILLNKY